MREDGNIPLRLSRGMHWENKTFLMRTICETKNQTKLNQVKSNVIVLGEGYTGVAGKGRGG